MTSVRAESLNKLQTAANYCRRIQPNEKTQTSPAQLAYRPTVCYESLIKSHTRFSISQSTECPKYDDYEALITNLTSRLHGKRIRCRAPTLSCRVWYQRWFTSARGLTRGQWPSKTTNTLSGLQTRLISTLLFMPYIFYLLANEYAHIYMRREVIPRKHNI